MELNFWTQCEVTKASYDDKTERWQVALRTADGGKRHMSPRHVIMATGVSGIPNLPKIDSLSAFKGQRFIPANIMMAKIGQENMPSLLVAAIAAMISHKTCIQAVPKSP
jgi:hypothetical protein